MLSVEFVYLLILNSENIKNRASGDDATVEMVQYRNPITSFKFTKTVVPLGVCCTPPVSD